MKKIKNPKGAGRKLKYGTKTKYIKIVLPVSESEDKFNEMKSLAKDAVDIVVNDFMVLNQKHFKNETKK
jgi:uncharacterized Zn ribbon protein